MRYYALATCLLLMSIAVGAGAQAPAALSTPSAPPVTLAQAMAALPADLLGNGKVMMAVYGGMVPIPGPATAASTLPSDTIVDPLDRISATYDRSVQTFGHVTAIAPRTMVILNTSPDLGDIPFAELAGQRPLPFLLGTLTPDQMRLLATSGLGFADLNADQQALLKAALPHPFLIVPREAVTPSVSQADLSKPGPRYQAAFKRLQEMNAAYKAMEQTIPDDQLFQLLKLHANLTADISLPGKNGSGAGFNLRRDMPALGPYKLTYEEFDEFNQTATQERLQSLLSAKEPNVLKDGDLDWKRTDLRTSLSLSGIKTVEDLVVAVSKATGLELYADNGYQHLPIDFAGATDQPQSAVDLLQGLSLCVCGAWRKVGPCWILTDDEVGYGTRYAALAEAVQRWSNRLTDADKAIGGHLVDLDWPHQFEFLKQDPSALPKPLLDKLTSSGKTSGNIAWKDLPQVALDGIDAQIKSLSDEPQLSSFTEEALQERDAAQPDSPTWCSLGIAFSYELPQTGLLPFGQMAYNPQLPEAPTEKDAGPPANRGKIDLTESTRAVLCSAETQKGAVAIVDRLPDAGFNTLYLDVFHNGRAFFQNPAVKPESADAAGVLKAAIDEGARKGIAVDPVVDLFCWRKDGGAAHPAPWPAIVAQDLTVNGEPADVDIRRRIDNSLIRNDLELDDMRVTEGNHSWVSPFDPNVGPILDGLLGALASTKGIAGIVVEDVAPPGYIGAEDRIDSEAALGYTSTARLAYLRKNNVDPIDIAPEYSLSLWLPYQEFQTSFTIDMPSFQYSSSDGWFKFRAAVANAVAVDAQRAIRVVNPIVPILVREGQYGETFDPWPDGANPNVYVELNGHNEWEYVTSASLVDLPVAARIRSKPWTIVSDANWRIRHFGHGRAGGVVLDLVNGNTDEPSLRTLNQLAPYFAKAAGAAPSK